MFVARNTSLRKGVEFLFYKNASCTNHWNTNGHSSLLWTLSSRSAFSSEADLSPEALQRLATLAKLKLNEKDVPQLCKDVGNVLKYVERIQQIDTSGVEPLVSPIVEVTQAPLREDISSASNAEENANVLSNAKSKTGIFLAVPKIKEVD
eukprot:TRINITY_DN10893_c0_g1_i1.p1 TRINITY_DN10893_c0_g1~~TRINITY_DN10893_c0_g1_i1.p1  ORF type:complete len:150 (-),score=28.50 TRINITY_DN10893_c0_g1_i1:29-478(-)